MSATFLSALPIPYNTLNLRLCPKRQLWLQLRLPVCLFFDTGRRADLAVAVAELAVSNSALDY